MIAPYFALVAYTIERDVLLAVVAYTIYPYFKLWPRDALLEVVVLY